MKIITLLIIGLLFSGSVCNKVFANVYHSENSYEVKQIENSPNSHSKVKCCNEDIDEEIEILAVSPKFSSIKQNFTGITEYIAFRELDVKEISLKDPPFEYSGIKNSTENVILRE